ncbi:ABC transporter substrate-binding protein [Bordetella genomosp. 2]|uniref:ABC transporter substrate-binding protein n=1 Tax=Bordetella genomosp. 2 TaxID=1983456 RepID=A0A261VXV8_9BORD|nr:ABC transporter substrate-binding protein [Bordetella genomosp. 2]
MIKTMLAAAALAGGAAQAGAWPERPVTLVVPLSAGGSTDVTARLLAEKLQAQLGQPVVVENRTGAGGNIGAAYVAQAKPDGYTLLMSTSTLTTNVTLYKHMPLNVEQDLIPVAQVALIPNVLMVNKDFPAQTLAQFVDYVRDKKGPLYYGSAGNGTSQHLSGALFNNMVQGEMVHVPYRGGAPANADLMAGQVQAVFSPLVEVLPYIEGGKLRALGVTTPQRSARLPDVPAVGEALPGFEIVLWNGVFAPAGTPAEVVDRLNTAIGKVLQDPAVRQTFADQGSTPVGGSPAEFKQIVGSEIVKWGKLVKLSGAHID